MSETDVSKMKIADLKRELKLRSLLAAGTEKELQERLQAALLLSFEGSDIFDELLDDDDVLLTDEDIKLMATEMPNQQTKEVVLKRKNFLISIGSALNNSFDGATAIENYVPAQKQILKAKKSLNYYYIEIRHNGEGRCSYHALKRSHYCKLPAEHVDRTATFLWNLNWFFCFTICLLYLVFKYYFNLDVNLLMNLLSHK